MILPKVTDLKFLTRLSPETNRVERLQKMLDYYLNFCVEDPQDGTGLDCNIIDLVKQLQEHYKDNENDNRTTFYATTQKPAS